MGLVLLLRLVASGTTVVISTADTTQSIVRNATSVFSAEETLNRVKAKQCIDEIHLPVVGTAGSNHHECLAQTPLLDITDGNYTPTIITEGVNIST